MEISEMRTFVYMGPNAANKSGVSWKVWKIERRDRKVTVWFGKATVKLHKLVPYNTLSSKSWTFRTDKAAIEAVKKRIQEKENEGYEKIPGRSTSVT